MIEVRYKCNCMEKEASILIAERRANEDIPDYMNYLQMEIYTDHRRRSPLCLAAKIEYAKLPADNPDGIGYAVGGHA